MTDARSLAADRASAFRLVPVSHETSERLDQFVDLFLRWQRAVQLVSASTLPRLWTRHIADSLQIAALAPDAKVWLDLGTGGGFPGLIVAIAVAERAGALVHLVESDTRKAAFLREAARVTRRPRQSPCRSASSRSRNGSAASTSSPHAHWLLCSELSSFPQPWLAGGATGIFHEGTRC